MVRRGASLDADQTSRQLLEERQDVAPLQLTADDNLALRVDAVGLKHRLRDVETDCRDRLHDLLLRIVGDLTAPTSAAVACRVEEPSTASIGDQVRHNEHVLIDHLVNASEQRRRCALPGTLAVLRLITGSYLNRLPAPCRVD